MKNVFDKIEAGNKVKLLKLFEASIFTYQKDVYISSLIKHTNIIGIVLSGYLEIIRIDYNGNKTTIEELEKDSVFGSNISGLNIGDFEIIAKEESKVILIDYDVILNESDNKSSYYNQFIRNLLEITNEKIIEKNERIQILIQKSIRNKLLEYFNIISKKNNSKNIYLKSTFIDLADYLAVDRSAMSRELKNLKDEGFIKINGKKIILLY